MTVNQQLEPGKGIKAFQKLLAHGMKEAEAALFVLRAALSGKPLPDPSDKESDKE